jgi:hypothetical protein
MKKLIATAICIVVLSMTALPVAAQRRGRWVNRPVYNSRYDSRYDNRVYNDRVYNDNYRYGRDRSVWDRHRDKITTAGGAAGGALLGGLIGGKKGAIIGAITGGAGAALYTYKIRDKYSRSRRY